STYVRAYEESTSVTSHVVTCLFLVILLFTQYIDAISVLPSITSPAVIIVGSYMMAGLERINCKKFDEAFPAFAVILSMPLTSSISTGIAVGFITYPLLKLVSGNGKQVHPLVYVFGVIFILQMIYFPGN